MTTALEVDASMAIDLSETVPPDDTGTDTFRRYCYQAHTAFPFCLDCALGGVVRSVVAEHIEDIAVEYADRWRFIQIKTRDPHLGPWKLSDLIGQGGGLQALLRSYRVLTDYPTTHELFLEGAIDPKDDAALLLSPDGRKDGRLIKRIGSKLGISCDECSSFIGRVRLSPGRPSRSSIAAENLVILGKRARGASIPELEGVYVLVISKIQAAMSATLLDPLWYGIVHTPDDVSDEARQTYAAKRLTREILGPLIKPVVHPVRSLLRRIVEPDGTPPTVLEAKLLTGGASAPVILTAKSLRAQASIRELECASASIYPDYDDLLEDVRERLRIQVESLVARHQDSMSPAIAVWDELLQRLPQASATIDRGALFHQDPYLLLGEICQLSDLCLTDWGVARA